MSLPRIRHHGLFAGVLALLLVGGCTTAELAVDLLKKSQRQTDSVATDDPYSDQGTVTSSIGTATVKANPVYKVGDP